MILEVLKVVSVLNVLVKRMLAPLSLLLFLISSPVFGQSSDEIPSGYVDLVSQPSLKTDRILLFVAQQIHAKVGILDRIDDLEQYEWLEEYLEPLLILDVVEYSYFMNTNVPLDDDIACAVHRVFSRYKKYIVKRYSGNEPNFGLLERYSSTFKGVMLIVEGYKQEYNC